MTALCDGGTRIAWTEALIVTLVAMWGFRLGAYLFWRKQREPGEDFRYAAMRERMTRLMEMRAAKAQAAGQ